MLKRLKSIKELLGMLADIDYEQSLSFLDDDENLWYLSVEKDWIAFDTSITEDKLTEDDYEEYTVSHLNIDFGRGSYDSVGESITKAIVNVLFEANLIPDKNQAIKD